MYMVTPMNDESYEQYLLRLGSQKDELEWEGTKLSWTKIAGLMNEFTNEDFSESKYRKEYHLLKKGIDLGVEKATNVDQFEELQEKTQELQKQKFQMQDQKRELNNKIRLMARFEHLKDEVSRSIDQLGKLKPLNYEPIDVWDGSVKIRANVLASDWHYGMIANNTVNTYNPEVFKRRFQKWVQKVIHYCKAHKVDELTIGQIGDQIHGGIHVTARIESSEDVISQTMYVAERMAEAIQEFSKVVPKIRVINIIGNHSRTQSRKEENLMNENFERLIPWHLSTRLEKFENVEILVGEDGYYLDTSFRIPDLYVHGDLDYVTSVAKTIPQFLNVIPGRIFSGHIHHDTVKDFGRTIVISNGSLCGSDSYSVSKRLYSDAMQKMHIFDADERIEYTIGINVQYA